MTILMSRNRSSVPQFNNSSAACVLSEFMCLHIFVVVMIDMLFVAERGSFSCLLIAGGVKMRKHIP